MTWNMTPEAWFWLVVIVACWASPIAFCLEEIAFCLEEISRTIRYWRERRAERRSVRRR